MKTTPRCGCISAVAFVKFVHRFRPSFFVVAPSDRLSPPLDIQLETINCTAFSVRWKMPRRHVSTITGYKVVHFSFISSSFFFYKTSKPLERYIIWSNLCRKKTLLHTLSLVSSLLPSQTTKSDLYEAKPKAERKSLNTQQHTPLKKHLL